MDLMIKVQHDLMLFVYILLVSCWLFLFCLFVLLFSSFLFEWFIIIICFLVPLCLFVYDISASAP